MVRKQFLTRNRTVLAAAIIATVLVVAAACGNGGDDDDESISVSVFENRISQIFDDGSPSVVHITSIVLDRDQQMQPLPPQVGTVSGFIVDKQGHVITNNHGIDGAAEVRVTWPNGLIVQAEVVGTDPSADLAVLRIDVPISDEMVVTLGNSDELRVGNLAVAIGSPFGFQQTLTSGVISALGRNLQAQDGYGTEIRQVIQTDAAINPGNSGGPMFNSSGEVVGVTTAIFTLGGGFEGIGFVIPINTVKELLPTLIDQGFVLRPSIGVSGIALSPDRSQFLGIPVDRGLLLQKVRSGSTGEDAGLRAGTTLVDTPIGPILVDGDLLVEVEDRPIDSMATLSKVIEQREVGDELEVEIVRDGESLTIKVIVGQLTTAPVQP